MSYLVQHWLRAKSLGHPTCPRQPLPCAQLCLTSMSDLFCMFASLLYERWTDAVSLLFIFDLSKVAFVVVEVQARLLQLQCVERFCLSPPLIPSNLYLSIYCPTVTIVEGKHRKGFACQRHQIAIAPRDDWYDFISGCHGIATTNVYSTICPIGAATSNSTSQRDH